MDAYQDKINERLTALNLPTNLRLDQYQNLLDFYQQMIDKYSDRPVYSCLGHTISFQELDEHANAFAAFLQDHQHLQPGDRIALQLPNILQFPVAFLGAMRAGLIIVNTNPLYTATELEHQLNDSGAKALLVLANVADTAAKIVAKTSVKTIIVTELADLHPQPKRFLLNAAVKYIKKMVPNFHFKESVKFSSIMSEYSGKLPDRISKNLDDVAILQYTGGTTGVAKGAMLTHGNVLANAMQCAPIFDSFGLKEQDRECIVQPLPLYHIYACTVGLVILSKGAHTVLVPNPRDLPSLVKAMGQQRFTGFCGLNTLFIALCKNEQFKQLDFSALKMTLSGGMALTQFAAEQWQQVTGKVIYEGYGLTETSPVVSVNPGGAERLGTIGVPVPETQIAIRDDDGYDLPIGERGELCVKGPQVMKGYWQREEATAESIIDGWFATGDIAILDDEGYLSIVDRKKDMILVSGFNVYPNEVEDTICNHADVLEAAAIAEKDEQSGEVVHVYAVLENRDNHVSESDLRDFCRQTLTGYKIPKRIFFVDELPKTNVGKVLRRKVKEHVTILN